MYEKELRHWAKETGGPTWKQITEEVLEALGVDPVLEGPQAIGGTVYQFSMRQGVEQVDGKWYTKYVLGPVFYDRPATELEPAQTAAEQEAAYKAQKDAEQAQRVRIERTQRLKDTDWVVIKALESNTPQSFEMAAYRQALRDITTQSGFPWTVNWPDQP
jgi:hypothetical protein